MNKINVLLIVRDHYGTFRDSDGRVRLGDWALFLGVPICIYVISIGFGVMLDSDVYGQSISVFSIFSALLFSAQVAIYSLCIRAADRGADRVSELVAAREWQLKVGLFREINANISYLILLSCGGISLFLAFFAFELPSDLEAALTLLLFSHFVLTLLMVVKRTHVAFTVSYKERE